MLIFAMNLDFMEVWNVALRTQSATGSVPEFLLVLLGITTEFHFSRAPL